MNIERAFAKKVCRGRSVQIAGLVVDLIVLDMSDFDVLLGMDWLSTHHAVVNCDKRSVQFGIPNIPTFVLNGQQPRCCVPIVSAVRARHLISSGCTVVSGVDT